MTWGKGWENTRDSNVYVTILLPILLGWCEVLMVVGPLSCLVSVMQPVALALCLLLVAALPVHAGEDAPVAVARAISMDMVRVTLATDDELAGSILPFCKPSAMAPGQLLAGTIESNCFQPLATPSSAAAYSIWQSPHLDSPIDFSSGIPICEPVQGSILPPGGPPVVIEPNDHCIESTLKWLRNPLQGMDLFFN